MAEPKDNLSKGRVADADLPKLPSFVTDKDILRMRTEDGRIVYCHRDLTPDDIPRRNWKYAETTALYILQQVQEGKTLKEVSQMDAMPPLSVIKHWLRNHEDFKEQMRLARIDRAETFHDDALALAHDTKKKSDVGINKLKIDTLKWAASVNDKETFGHAPSAGGIGSVTIVVQTGIDRTIEVEKPNSWSDEQQAIAEDHINRLFPTAITGATPQEPEEI